MEIKLYKILGVDGEYMYSTKYFHKLQEKCLDWYDKKPKTLDEAIEIIESGKHYLITS